MLWVQISIRARCSTLCDQVSQWLATDRWFSSGPPVSSTNKTDRHDITEILLKVALNTFKQTHNIHTFPVAIRRRFHGCPIPSTLCMSYDKPPYRQREMNTMPLLFIALFWHFDSKNINLATSWPACCYQ